jgi:hypothetical protein
MERGLVLNAEDVVIDYLPLYVQGVGAVFNSFPIIEINAYKRTAIRPEGYLYWFFIPASRICLGISKLYLSIGAFASSAPIGLADV